MPGCLIIGRQGSASVALHSLSGTTSRTGIDNGHVVELVFELVRNLTFGRARLPATGKLQRVSEGMQHGKVVIEVIAARSETKHKMACDIADALGIERPAQSRGSSVDSTFLDRIHTALTGDESTKTDAYRKAERVLQDLDLTYDPFWDTSESAGDTGGSTVTNRAYSRVRSAVTNVPRCFLINVNDSDVGSAWETDHEFRYAFDESVSGRDAFKDAGPGSRVVYYSTKKNNSNPMHFVAHAEVEYIGPGWTGPWEARIANYTEFERPVHVDEVMDGNWNRQISITEITYGTYIRLLEAGGGDLVRSEDAVNDPGGDVVARRVLEEIPLPQHAPDLAVPYFLPIGDVSLQPAREPVYTESEAKQTVTTGDLPTPKTAARNKLAETRAVELVTQALEAQGWTMVMDCQKFGVGYDLLFQKDSRRIHAEVKGIISNTLAFNLTPKETWRVETDDDFAVIAVTNVLSPTAYELHFLTRQDLARAQRIVTGYRLKF